MKSLALAGLVSTLLFVPALLAQDLPNFPPPQKEHEWLQQFVGEWETESEVSGEAGQPGMKCSGTMKCRSLGGFWVVSDVKNDMPGFSVSAVQMIGYDPKAKKYIGTWIDSVMNHMWKYEGTVDKTGRILTLEAEGPDMVDQDKTAKYRDVYEIKSKDLIENSSLMQSADGKWVKFMSGKVTRKK